MRANISDEKINAIIHDSGVPFTDAIEIIDPEFTFWSERGDCDQSQHFCYIEDGSVEEIAEWVASVYRDRQS